MVVWHHSGYLGAVDAVILVRVSGCFATVASSSERAAFVLLCFMQVLWVRAAVLGSLPTPSCFLIVLGAKPIILGLLVELFVSVLRPSFGLSS
jgi:hypothetical protein